MIIAFELTMPNSGSWNGQWSGQNNKYYKFRTLSKGAVSSLLGSKDYDNWHYSWNDGWSANVKAWRVSSKMKRSMLRISAGFSGYEWMIDSILESGKILNSQGK